MDIQEKYDIGIIIVKDFFALSDKEIKEKLSSILDDDNDKYSYVLGKNSSTKRTISNEIPVKIVVSFYDAISISPFGITYLPEHGDAVDLVKFTKHFKL